MNLRQQKNVPWENDNSGTTHYEGCWRSGDPKHYLCALETLKDIITILPDNTHKLIDSMKWYNPMGFKNEKTGDVITKINYLDKTFKGE